MEFSVLMSVYYNEKSEFLDNAFESILINQSVKPTEVVLVKDGNLTEELELIIEKYLKLFPENIKIVALKKNVGLGKALEIGINECTHNLIARSDTDDINDKKRFERQLNEFAKFPELDIVGSNIAEFYNSPSNIIFLKKVPEESIEIIRMSKTRNPLNHMTVMFKKESVLKAGSYKHLFYLEDYFLWIRMIKDGCNFKNINESLVYVRTGENMYKRRSNPMYIKSWYELQKFMFSNKMISIPKFFINMIGILGFILTPPRIKKYVYKFFLRSNN